MRLKPHLLIAIFIVAHSCCFAQTPEEIRMAFSKSYESEKSKNYAGAIAELKKIYNANSYEMNLRLGWLYYMNAEHATAQSYYEKCIALKPASIEAMLGYANPTAALEKWDDVLNMYQKILKIDPAHSVTNYRVALIYYYRKDFTKAEQYNKVVLDHYPFDYSSLLLMAGIKIGMGKIVEAKEYYRKVLLYSPSDATATQAYQKL